MQTLHRIEKHLRRKLFQLDFERLRVGSKITQVFPIDVKETR